MLYVPYISYFLASRSPSHPAQDSISRASLNRPIGNEELTKIAPDSQPFHAVIPALRALGGPSSHHLGEFGASPDLRVLVQTPSGRTSRAGIRSDIS